MLKIKKTVKFLNINNYLINLKKEKLINNKLKKKLQINFQGLKDFKKILDNNLIFIIKSKKNWIDENLLRFKSLEFIKKQNSYRYKRLENSLPVRGQRTRTNAKTRRKRNVK